MIHDWELLVNRWYNTWKHNWEIEIQWRWDYRM